MTRAMSVRRRARLERTKQVGLMFLGAALLALGVMAAGAQAPGKVLPECAFSSVQSCELPPCPTEDSVHCVWDASERGNGRGEDVVNP